MDLYTLTNRNGLVAKITNLGGHVTELHVPDRDGRMADIVLGHSTLDPYLDRKTNPYFGSIVGRYANRIAKGKFTLDGKEYTLDANNGANHLHGGKMGFDLKLWKAEPMPDNRGTGPAAHLHQPRRRGGLPRQARHHRRLHADARQRPADRLHGDDRQADADEPDQPRLLQPLPARRRARSSPTTCCN